MASGRKIAQPPVAAAAKQAVAQPTTMKFVKRYRDDEKLPFNHAKMFKIIDSKVRSVELPEGGFISAPKRTERCQQIITNVFKLENTGIPGLTQTGKKAFVTKSGQGSWDVSRKEELSEEQVIRSWMANPSYNSKFYITWITDEEYEEIMLLQNDPVARAAYEALHGDDEDSGDASAMLVGDDGKRMGPLPSVTIPALPQM